VGAHFTRILCVCVGCQPNYGFIISINLLEIGEEEDDDDDDDDGTCLKGWKG
jgi:hypothetical protein